MLYGYTNERLAYSIISVLLFIHALLLKPGNCKINDVESNPNTTGGDVTQKRGGFNLYPHNRIVPKNNTHFNNSHLSGKLNVSSWNFTGMELCYLLFGSDPDNGNSYCNMTWDGLSCWPASLVGEFAIIQCPQNMQGVDSTQNATRLCTTNGTWALKSDYNSCLTDTNPKDLYNGVESVHEYSRRIIYNLGFIVSTITLIIALFIFLYFRSLRCLRNIIHSHLIATFILRNLLWIMMQHTLWPIVQADEKWACKLEVALFNYAQMTNFFWMLVEGLYLHIIIVWTYSADKIRKWYFIIIGWCVPAVIITIWVIFRTQVTADETSDVAACFMPKSKNYAESEADKLDYIYIAPILFVLAVNIIFLGSIIWILVTKLRSSHSLETKQLRKAVKATITLFPLLGITYVIFIWPPSDNHIFVEVHQYINAFLQSFQGFFVALFYCFLNGEVQTVIKKKITNWVESRANYSLITRLRRS
ncbi:corticotropin-releasing factor receptor 2-like isoform X2 [Mytilus galloprovincialis]|uniref:corticotropin-releasing factor receptor 2-like isoform X2 n=1 Tax=Mytilus galloprovincialis TaxID=29158 RepID=UPI003F7C2B34